MNITAIVPSLNPDEKFIEVINSLIKIGFEKIIIVDDGSSSEKKGIFNIVLKNKQCTLLPHNKNLGKGRALKTAFNHFLNTSLNDIGVVTIDGDGQHLPKDILSCSKELISNPDALILGARNFNLKDIPSRSKFGNKITSFALKNLCGIKITDTQTGLRAIPINFVKQILDLPGERFEYETNMLLECKKKNIKIIEVPIETVYIKENESSHFNPLTDSISIYKLIGKFVWSSIAAMLCDFALFVILKLIFSYMPLELNLLIATFGARIISSLLNFIVNKNIVFSNSSSIKLTILKYYSLCAVQTTLSYLGVYLLASLLFFNATASKVIVDFILFLCSFKIQLSWVFKSKQSN